MSLLSRFESFYQYAKQNKWFWFFSIFNRIVLAIGFIAAGLVKILGERFASGLSIHHPMGHYLEALHVTGYYYTFIGYAQVVAAVLLLIPATVTLGAVIYFPIILNICILSFAVRFEGSLFTAPLMVLSNLFILFWNYDKIKNIFPVNHSESFLKNIKKPHSYKFPLKFFTGVVVTTILVVAIAVSSNKFATMPRNSLEDCKRQFTDKPNAKAGYDFCDCIHTKGNPLGKCLKEYNELTK